jgi:hypothetical protein
MQFSFATAHTIHFGPGTPAPAGPHAGRLGRRAMKDGFAIVLMDEGWQSLVKSIIRIGAHLVALPGRLARSLTSGLRAATLIFVPHTALTQIPAAAADNLFHGCHRYLVREGWKIEGKESEE